MLDEYFKSKEFKEYLRLYEQEEGPSATLDSEALTDIADYYRSQGSLEKGLQAVDFALSIYPGATAPLVFKARAALAQNDVDRAEQFVDMIDDKTDLDYYYMVAEIMVVRGRENEADEYLEQKMDVIPEEDVPDYVLDVAAIFCDYDLNDLGHKWLNRSEQEDLNDYKELSGRIHMANMRLDEAERIFDDLVEQAPFSVVYWNLLAAAQYLQKKYKETITSSEFAIAIDPRNEEALLNKANALSVLGNYDDALDFYQQFAMVTEKTDLAEMYIGITLVCLEKIEEALPHLESALKLSAPGSPYYTEIFHELMLALARIGKTDEAIERIKNTKSGCCDPNEMDVLHAHLLLAKGDQSGAQELFQKAFVESEFSHHIVLRIAVSLYDNGYIKESYMLLKNLLDDEEESQTEGYSHLAACAHELGEYDEFLKYLKLATKRNPYEARCILGEWFPEELDPEGYYEYATNHKI